MTAEQQLVDSGLRTWKTNADRAASFFQALDEDGLDREVAPGRNRLRYIWGHLAAVGDSMLPLLGIGPRLHPELDAMFLANPDSGEALLSGAELKRISTEIDAALWSAFNAWTPAEWLGRHTAVSEDDFAREPHRNRFTVLLGRAAHTSFHLGQAILTKPRA